MLLLLACHRSETPDPPEDTAWITLPATCDAPSPLAADPLNLVAQDRITQEDMGPFLEALDVEVVDDLLYVVGKGLLVIEDISDPTSPRRLYGPADRESGKLHRVEALEPGWLATSQRELGVFFWDVADPAQANVVGAADAVGAEGLAYAEGYLFVAVRDEGVRTLDVSDPRAPVEVGRGSGLQGAWELTATGDGWLYAADSSLGLVPIDVRDPRTPTVGTPVPMTAMHVRYADDRVYVALGGDGIGVYDVTDRANPVWVEGFHTGGSVVMTDVADGRLWAVDHESVTVFDLASGTPIHKDEVEEFALAVDAEGNHGFVGDWNMVEVWEVGDTLAPALGVPESLALAGGEATATLTNYGGAPLTLTGAIVDGGSVEVSSDTIGPGEAAALRVSNVSADTTLCLASDDPDTPVRTLTISAGSTPPAGVAAPDFALADLDGNTWRLSEQSGSPVLLVYFATW